MNIVTDTRPEHKTPAQTAYFKIKIVITAAMIDRLVHHAEVINTSGTQSCS